jgi:hypothetical protein
MFIAWTMCGVMSARVAALCFSCSLHGISNGDQKLYTKLQDQWALMAMNRPTAEIWTHYSSLVTALFPVYAQGTPINLTWGLLRARAACPTPRLNLRFKLRPSWNNIHDTFPTGSAQYTICQKISGGTEVHYTRTRVIMRLVDAKLIHIKIYCERSRQLITYCFANYQWLAQTHTIWYTYSEGFL